MERDLKLMNRSRGLYFLGILLFFLLGLSASPQAVLGGQDPQESSSSASGSEQQKAVEAPSDVSATTEIQDCQSCHGDITASFERTPHWKTMNDTRGGHAKQGCEACHGPGGDHADDPSKPVFDFKKATSEDTTDRCLTCHASGSEHLSASNSFHRQNNVSCTSCHSMHHATTREHMLIKREPGLCYSCHLQQKAQFNMPFRHRVNEGLITCTDCHNQHGTSSVLEGDHLVRQVRASASDRKSTRLNSSHEWISYAVFCLKKKKISTNQRTTPSTCCFAISCGSGGSASSSTQLCSSSPDEPSPSSACPSTSSTWSLVPAST